MGHLVVKSKEKNRRDEQYTYLSILFYEIIPNYLVVQVLILYQKLIILF